MTWPGTEVSRLVHVYPEGIDIETTSGAEEQVKFFSPEILSGLMKPVRVNRGPRPDNSLIDRAIAILEECTNLNTSIIGIVILETD